MKRERPDALESRLRDLPRDEEPPPASLEDRVLARVAAEPLPRRRARIVPMAAGLAAAAAVLLLLVLSALAPENTAQPEQPPVPVAEGPPAAADGSEEADSGSTLARSARRISERPRSALSETTAFLRSAGSLLPDLPDAEAQDQAPG